MAFLQNDVLVEEVKEQRDQEEELKEKEPIDIPTRADMIQVVKRIDTYLDETSAEPHMQIQLKEIRNLVRKTQRASARQSSPLLNFF